MYTYPFKCFHIVFALDFQAMEVRNRISNALVAEFDLRGDPVEVKVDAENDSFELALLPGGLPEPVIEAPAIDISQDAFFEVNSDSYRAGGVTIVRIEGLRSAGFFLNNGTMTFQLIDGMMHMVGKPTSDDLLFYNEVERAIPSTPVGECP